VTGPARWVSDEEVALPVENIGGMLDRVAAEHPERDALVFHAPGTTPRRWTYQQLVEEADRVARALLARFAPGENVAVWSSNRAEWVLLQHGAARAGLCLVTINPAYLHDEASYVLRQSRSAGLFYTPAFRDTDVTAIVARLGQALSGLRLTISLDDWDGFRDSADPGTPLPEVDPGHAAMIQYTSGTTGEPKGVLLSHQGLLDSARLVAARAELESGVVSVNAMPLFHVGGCGTMELGTLARAGTYVLAPGFDAGHVLHLLEEHRGTTTLAVPTMLLALLEHPDRAHRDLSDLRTIVTGGASAPADLVRRVKATFGCLFTITFGQTETSGPAIQTSVRDSERDQAETIGRPLPRTEVRITDPDDGSVVPFGDRGEIQMRGPTLMLGYFDRPEETRGAVDDEGWLHSGDLGSMDDRGFVTVTGRIRDMINRGGEKIYPREIEDLLTRHEAVADAAVVGVADPRWGESVAAVIRLSGTIATTSDQDLDAYCRQHLARYKVPSAWYFVDALPLTPSGKVQKYVLRDQIQNRVIKLDGNQG
jgi:fatty-acyl-CoA synthase